jgi:hypothetical protein
MPNSLDKSKYSLGLKANYRSSIREVGKFLDRCVQADITESVQSYNGTKRITL